MKFLLGGFLRTWYRLHIGGAENIPAQGATIVAPNHKSFWDTFFVALATKRHVRFMGKSELFEGRKGRLLVRLGAVPVRRGQTDEEALETARTILRRAGCLLFPEGSRVAIPVAGRTPTRRGAADARDAGGPSCPPPSTAARGFRRALPRPVKVQVARAAGPGAPSPRRRGDRDQAIENQVWPEVDREYGRLKARPRDRRGLALVGLGGRPAKSWKR